MNGVMYYVYLFALSTTNLVINMHAPRSYGNLLSMFQQVVHSVLACRMLFQLRECGKQTICGDDFRSAFTLNLNTLVFKADAPGDECPYTEGDGEIRSTTSFREEDAC